MSIRTIAICGDGASAAIVLLALCHKAGNPHLRIVMIGTGDTPGAGAAYDADNPGHLLNVPAEHMSADPAQPSQFRDWLTAQGIDVVGWPHGFTAREHHAAYLADCVRHAIASHKRIEIHKGEVKTLIRDHNAWVVSHTAGPSISADLVVLARSNDRLIENIITSRIARAAPEAAGLDVDDKNRVRDGHGQPHLSLFALGALTRPQWWEITAIPEISRQAYAVAGYAREQLGVQDSAARVNTQAEMP